MTASALPTDKTFANQLKAGAILEKLFPEQPDHPGITHYIIHSYDVPALADRAHSRGASLRDDRAGRAARAAHAVAHVHARRRLAGFGRDQHCVGRRRAISSGTRAEELHAMDYMAYAYLQTGQDKAVAGAAGPACPRIAAVFDPNAIAGAAPGSAGVFAIAAIPARWVLERRDWAAAARLEPQAEASFLTPRR